MQKLFKHAQKKKKERVLHNKMSSDSVSEKMNASGPYLNDTIDSPSQRQTLVVDEEMSNLGLWIHIYHPEFFQGSW